MKKSGSGVFFPAAYFSVESQLLLSPDARDLSLPREAAGGQSGELMCGQFTLWQISFSARFNAYHRDHYNWPASAAADDHLCYYDDRMHVIDHPGGVMIIINGVAGRFH